MSRRPHALRWLARRGAASRLAALVALSWVAALALSAPSAQAIGTLNSGCNPPGGGGFIIVSYGGVAAQSFPAIRSGKLLTVDITQLAREGGGTGGPFNVQLYGADSAGTPVAPVLASTTIPETSINADDYFHDYSAQFEPTTAAYLTAGKTYAIALSTGDSKQDSWYFKEGDPCHGVALFSGGPPFGPVYPDHTDFDAGLRTYLGPANDDFERAEVLSGAETAAEGTTAGGTRQPGEPDHYVNNPPDSELWEGDHTVWYRWTAPHNGATSIDTCIGEIDSILAVYTGSELTNLTRVADNNNDPACSAHDEYGSKVSFEAVVGTTYDIVVGDAGGAREKPFGIVLKEAPDVTPPDTQIDSGPSGPTTNSSPTFTFSSPEPGSSFQCRLDSSNAAAFKPCSSPKTYSSLAPGAHKFEAQAIDAAQNVDPTPAARSFVVEATHEGPGPGPPHLSIETFIRKTKISRARDRATFRFASNEAGATFLCKFDRKPFKGCTSPKTYRHLKPGRHRFQVEARSPLGALDPSPAVRKFSLGG